MTATRWSLCSPPATNISSAFRCMACVFGDIFLEDLKRWREENLAKVGLRGIFPIWKIDSRELIREFFALGFGSVICCTNDAYLGEDAVGRNIDEGFIAALPPEVDPCGENGEFHSFAFAGPIFKQPVKFTVGEKVYRPVEATHPSDSNSSYVCPAGPRRTKGFWFCDLRPAKTEQLKTSSPTTNRKRKNYEQTSIHHSPCHDPSGSRLPIGSASAQLYAHRHHRAL